MPKTLKKPFFIGIILMTFILKGQNSLNKKSTTSNESAKTLKYIINKCKEIDSYILSEEELAELNSKEKKLLRNFFFAKYNYAFKDEKFTTYFKQFSWYKPIHKSVDSLLTYYDKENLGLIKVVESENFTSTLNQSAYVEILNGCWQHGSTAVAGGYEERFVFVDSDKSFVRYTNQMDGKNTLVSYSGFFTLSKNNIELEIRTKVFLDPKKRNERVKNLEDSYEYKTILVSDISTYTNRDDITRNYLKISGQVYWKYSSDFESCH